MASKGISRSPRELYDSLTPREREVLVSFTQDFTYAQAADRLGVSLETYRQHAQAVRNKLGLSSRSACAVWAVRHGYA